jgi:hypothetical protein
MKLVTKQVEKELAKYPLHSQSDKKQDAICVVKFFLTGGAHTWYILEADLKENMAFGIAVNGYGECEYGYVSLTELQNLKNSWGCGVERDICHTPKPLYEMKDECYLVKFLNRLYGEA